jgi:putative membrane protein insertion efficiency factor
MKQISRAVVTIFLRGYKWAISPMLLPACRYVPTCSDYALEAVDRYGAMRGGAMAIWRVLRCNPFSRGGIDLVVKSSSLPVRSHETGLCSH